MSSIMHASRFLLGEAARGDGGKGRANVEVSQKYEKIAALEDELEEMRTVYASMTSGAGYECWTGP